MDEQEQYDYYGKGGHGAPYYDENGEVVTTKHKTDPVVNAYGNNLYNQKVRYGRPSGYEDNSIQVQTPNQQYYMQNNIMKERMQKMELLNKLNENKSYMQSLQQNYQQVLNNNTKLMQLIETEKQSKQLLRLRAQRQIQNNIYLPEIASRSETPFPFKEQARESAFKTPIQTGSYANITNQMPNQLSSEQLQGRRSAMNKEKLIKSKRDKSLYLNPLPKINEVGEEPNNIDPQALKHQFNELRSMKEEMSNFFNKVSSELHGISTEIRKNGVGKDTQNKINDMLNQIQNEDNDQKEMLEANTSKGNNATHPSQRSNAGNEASQKSMVTKKDTEEDDINDRETTNSIRQTENVISKPPITEEKIEENKFETPVNESSNYGNKYDTIEPIEHSQPQYDQGSSKIVYTSGKLQDDCDDYSYYENKPQEELEEDQINSYNQKYDRLIGR